MPEIQSTVPVGIFAELAGVRAPLLAEIVLFETDSMYTERYRGMYYPTQRLVAINLHRCITDDLFSGWGMVYSARVFITILYTMFHEFHHARQLQMYPDLSEQQRLSDKLEQEADRYALEDIKDWMFHHDIPPIDQMGWVGEIIEWVLKEHHAEGELLAAKQGFAASVNSLHRGNYPIDALNCVQHLAQGGVIGETHPGGVFLKAREVIQLRTDCASGSSPFGEVINETLERGGGPMDNKTRLEFINNVHNILHGLMSGQQVDMDPKFYPWIANHNYRPTKQGLPMWDFTLNMNGQVLELRFVVQNPFKQNSYGQLSQYAIAAQQGAKITWVINKTTNQFLGSCQNGGWVKSQPRANNTAPQSVNQVMSQAPGLPYVPPKQIPQHLEGQQNYYMEDDGCGNLTFYGE